MASQSCAIFVCASPPSSILAWVLLLQAFAFPFAFAVFAAFALSFWPFFAVFAALAASFSACLAAFAASLCSFLFFSNAFLCFLMLVFSQPFAGNSLVAFDADSIASSSTESTSLASSSCSIASSSCEESTTDGLGEAVFTAGLGAAVFSTNCCASCVDSGT